MLDEPKELHDAYHQYGYLLVPGFLPPEWCGFLSHYLGMQKSNGRLCRDQQVEESLVVYGDPAFDTLLGLTTPAVERLLGLDLTPTYSFARLYFAGAVLSPHTDRPACEHSVTLHLGAEADSPWPIHIERTDGAATEIVLDVGDALLYRGCERRHWRSQFMGTWYGQVFLHYVDTDGPNAAHRFDGRTQLGAPAISCAKEQGVSPHRRIGL